VSAVTPKTSGRGRIAIAGHMREHARVALALVAVLIAFAVMLRPGDAADVNQLARKFAFAPIRMPDPPGAGRPHTIRQVNPSLQRIDAWISSVGAAVALGDFDGNGIDDDMCHVDPRFDSVTVAPVPGTGSRYAPIALEPRPLPYNPATMAPMGCLPVDVNVDGRMDLVVYYWGRTPVAFVRTASGTYRPREIAPLAIWNTNAMTAADIDGDGHPDLIVGNYFADGARVLDADSTQPVSMQSSMSRATNGGTAHVLLWRPGGHYREARGAIPSGAQHGWTLAVGAQDLNGDMLPELYFANDFGNDRLLRNASTPGRVRFTVVTGTKGFGDASSKVLGHDSFKGMGIDFADLNGDARPDLFVSNITEPFALMESNFAWVSRSGQGPLEYADRSEKLGLARSGWGWDARLDDFDNDGSPEVLQATGFVRGHVNRWPELQELAIGNDAMLSKARHWPHFGPGTDLSGQDRDAFYTRGPGGRFHDIARQIGLRRGQVSRGIATADVNADGRLDFAIANQWQPSYVYLNRCPRPCGASLELRLMLAVPGGGVTPATGAQVTVRVAGGRPLVRQVDGGNGHSGKRSPALFFGLGGRRDPVSVTVRWRDLTGQVRTQTATLAPGIHTLVLGKPGGRR
jgi:enediyne biosynthesis protein E4